MSLKNWILSLSFDRIAWTTRDEAKIYPLFVSDGNSKSIIFGGGLKAIIKMVRISFSWYKSLSVLSNFGFESAEKIIEQKRDELDLFNSKMVCWSNNSLQSFRIGIGCELLRISVNSFIECTQN